METCLICKGQRSVQLIGAAEASLIIEHFFSYLPELTAFARHNKIRMTQQRLLSQHVGGILPNERHPRRTLMWAQEQHVEGFALRRRLQTKTFAGAGAIFVVIGRL